MLSAPLSYIVPSHMKHLSAKSRAPKAAPAQSPLATLLKDNLEWLEAMQANEPDDYDNQALKASIRKTKAAIKADQVSHAGLVGALVRMIQGALDNGASESDALIVESRAALKAANAGQPVGPESDGMVNTLRALVNLTNNVKAPYTRRNLALIVASAKQELAKVGRLPVV